VQPVTTFKTGDTILLRNRNLRKHKLAPKHTGPYRIKEFSRNGNVLLTNIDGRPFAGSHKPAKLTLYSKEI